MEVQVSCHELPPILALAVPTGSWHREVLAFNAQTTCMLTMGQLGAQQGEEMSLPAVRRSWVTSCSGTSLLPRVHRLSPVPASSWQPTSAVGFKHVLGSTVGRMLPQRSIQGCPETEYPCGPCSHVVFLGRRSSSSSPLHLPLSLQGLIYAQHLGRQDPMSTNRIRWMSSCRIP